MFWYRGRSLLRYPCVQNDQSGLEGKNCQWRKGTQRISELPTNTVDVRLNIRFCIIAVLIAPLIHQWQVIVHYHVNLHDIDTTRNDVRRDKDFFVSFTEAVNDRVTF